MSTGNAPKLTTTARQRQRSTSTEEPRLFKVVMHNDDFTTMDFVVEMLLRFFDKPMAEAVRIMQQVHHGGCAVAGIYPRQIAETKVAQVTREAEGRQMPFLVTFEPQD